MIATKPNFLNGRLKLAVFSVLMACFVFPAGGCSSTQDEPITAGNIEIQDPFEEGNRAVFAFNAAVDDAIVHPVVTGYRAVVPQPGRTGIKNFLRNLKSPVHLGNEVLQGDAGGAGNVVARTFINTLAGAGGLVDVAAAGGYRYQPEDFGQTLGVWGVGHGPYLVLPLLGSSSVRDYTGFFIDAYADPLRFWLKNTDRDEIYYTRMGLQVLTTRDELMDVLKELERSSIDYYAAVRSAYYQRREAELNDENADRQQIPDFNEYD